MLGQCCREASLSDEPNRLVWFWARCLNAASSHLGNLPGFPCRGWVSGLGQRAGAAPSVPSLTRLGKCHACAATRAQFKSMLCLKPIKEIQLMIEIVLERCSRERVLAVQAFDPSRSRPGVGAGLGERSRGYAGVSPAAS